MSALKFGGFFLQNIILIYKKMKRYIKYLFSKDQEWEQYNVIFFVT